MDPCHRLRCPGDAAARRPEEAGRIRGAGSGDGPAEGGARLEPVRGPGWGALSPGKGRRPVGGLCVCVCVYINKKYSKNVFFLFIQQFHL